MTKCIRCGSQVEEPGRNEVCYTFSGARPKVADYCNNCARHVPALQRIDKIAGSIGFLLAMLGIGALAIAGSAEAQQVPIPEGELVVVEAETDE